MQNKTTRNLIYAYTRQQALDDGVLIDVTETAQEAGLRYPTAITSTAWGEFVTVPAGVSGQDEEGRLWDIMTMLRYGIKSQKANGSEIHFKLSVKNDEYHEAELFTLKVIVGPGDDMSPVLTIMLPHED